MLWKCCTQYASTFGKLSSGHRTGKSQFSFQAQGRIFKLPHIVLISHDSKVMLKILQARLQQYMNQQLPDVQAGKLGLIEKRQRNQKSNCQNPLDHRKSKRFQKNIYFCLIDYAKGFDCVDHSKLWNILKEMGINCINWPPYLPPEKSVCKSRSNS